MNILHFVIPKSLVEYISTDSTVRQAMEKMRFHRYTAIPILDRDGKYVGTLRDDDIFKYFMENGSFDSHSAERDPAINILGSNYLKPLYHNGSITEVFDSVKEHNFVPVVDDRGCFIGIILRRDVMNFLLEFYERSEKN